MVARMTTLGRLHLITGTITGTIIGATLCLTSLAQADIEAEFNLDLIPEDQTLELVQPPAKIGPLEIYKRTQLVFDHYKVPEEPNYQTELDQIENVGSVGEFNKILQILDPKKQFSKFFSISTTEIQGFADRSSKAYAEMSLGLTEIESDEPQKLTLQGLKVAIDPGHMGTDLWDELSGKYIKDSKGNKLSEGLLNLQTALLVEEELKKLGVQTLITRNDLVPVTSTPFESLDVKDFARKELRLQSLGNWFQTLVKNSATTKAMFSNFLKSSKVKHLFSEVMRGDYFNLREDLDARVDVIEKFEPDITLVIHYDAQDKITVKNGKTIREKVVMPGLKNRTKAYVVGAFQPEEFSTREARMNLLRHVAQPKVFHESVKLSKSIVKKIHENLAIPYAVNADPDYPVVDLGNGVLARNLRVSRKLPGHAVSYLECLFYNTPAEFTALSKKDYAMEIGGASYSYSQRLLDVARAISAGVVEYVEGQQ